MPTTQPSVPSPEANVTGPDPGVGTVILAGHRGGEGSPGQGSSTSPVIIEHAYQTKSDAGADAVPTPTECNASPAADRSESRAVNKSNTDVNADINPVTSTLHLTPPEVRAVGDPTGPQERTPLAADGCQTYAAPRGSSTAPCRDAPFQAASYWDTDAHGISSASDGGYGVSVPSDPCLVAQILPFSLGQGVSLNSSPSPELELPLGKAEQGLLISAYLRETGTWCETTDSTRHFTVASHYHKRLKHIMVLS
ncbi:hypothetical protein FJTKL_13099 [Diaporthe vaccinii]|uniref:Uncharacterized protein n=1 Tax=Diaporthe vaccinii TaxID=105482 RepID=A0ABR4EBZ3_9PEZI